MIRRVARALVILLIFSFTAGCRANDPAVPATVDFSLDYGFTEPTPTPTPEPAPTPAPTPITLLHSGDMRYTYEVNEEMGIELTYPSHWIRTAGKKTLYYEEPSPEGVVPARFAVTYISAKSRPDYKQMRSQMNRFFTLLAGEYESFKPGKGVEREKGMGTRGYRRKYHASRGGSKISGYALLCYISSSKRLFLIHYCAPTERFDKLDAAWTLIMTSLKRYP